ncbi:MAG: HPr family phosphocarrier protein [Gammaproteobacteria bacterium]|jgi:phosphocarrier protein|nr:HPr family phosphocarrier protein [Gammaproteobacteria bacterium]
MKTVDIELVNRLGLHARAASKLVQTASRFESRVWLAHGDKRVNAKSIMGVLLLAAPCGTRLVLEVDGPDEEAAADTITALVADRFGEGE